MRFGPLRIDPREVYLKRLLSLSRPDYRSFRPFLNLALLFLENPATHEDSEEVTAALQTVKEWLKQFDTDRGEARLDYILLQLDIMAVYGRKYLKIKTRYTCKKFTFQEVVIGLGRVEDEIMFLIREKAREVRITNPDVMV